MSNENNTIEILDFINQHKQLDLVTFYERLRSNYNKKKSKLYKQLMSNYTEESTYEAICALNSYALQICLFAKNVDDKDLFFKFSRLDEVYKCLDEYANSFNIINCLRLLDLIKCDIKALETIYREN